MEAVEDFLEKVTEELLYNIVHDKTTITCIKLRNKFKTKTGHEPMELFGLGNKTGRKLLEFIKGIPGLKVTSKNVITICDDVDDSSDSSEDSSYEDNTSGDSSYEDDTSEESSYEDDTPCVYKTFNTTDLEENGMSVAEYREKLLIKCCGIMKDDFDDMSNSKDTKGNTPLHLLAALPSITTFNCEVLLKYLFNAGVDPLAANDNDQTFLHIIFGRFIAKFRRYYVCFKNQRITSMELFYQNDRKIVLDLISKELSQAQITSLAKAQDNYGNTILHECALTTTIQRELPQERETCRKLLTLDAGLSVRIPNINGEVPLHYAINASIFKIFVQTEDAVCRARNDRDETPVLFILKMSVGFAFGETSAFMELAGQCFVKTTESQNVKKAIKLLENLTEIVEENEEARKTVFFPDIEGNTAIDIVLVGIQIASYDLNISSKRMTELRSYLLALLRVMLRKASATDMKRRNRKDQSLLHLLLDMDDGNKHEIIKEKGIFQGVKILLKHDVDVNAVDSEGCTPLDVVRKNHDKRPTLYQKSAELLIKSGAVAKCDLGNDSSLVRGMSNLGICNETRKLRSCPRRHLDNAERLTDPNDEVVVRVGDYHYLSGDSIGSGAFSTVFVAIKDEHVDSNSGTIECRAYALKRLDKAKINPQEIKREITTLLTIFGKCENIIKYHDSFEDDFFQYLCLDLMDGDLREFVGNDNVNSVLKADPAVPVQVTTGIINGLAFLHEHDFIHRDLKPGNILYTTDPTFLFKIADFGLAKNMSTLSTMTSTRGGVAGTRCWMAPELVRMGSSEHTQQSDIFSLGLVLHYLLTLGKHPFAKRSEERPHVIERRIEEMRLHLDKALHPEAASFLQVLLTKDPSRRPPAPYLNQHPFLWSETKKIEFLKAVGDQPKAIHPTNFSHSPLVRLLQATRTGQEAIIVSWDQAIERLFKEMTKAWKQKKYRTDKVIDLVRFIRNAYAHKQERSLEFQQDLDDNIFLRKYPSLVLDVFDVVQQLDLIKNRSNIRQALSL